MDVVFAVNNDYCCHVAVAIYSLLTHNQQEKITIHLLAIDVDDKNIEKVKATIEQFSDVHFKTYQITKELFQNFPNPGIYSLASYLRLLIPSLLPTVSKVLYLDSDLMIRGSIRELWDIDLQNYSCAAVYDSILSYEIVKDYLGYDYFKDGYVNSGVLLLNLKYWRNHDVQYKLFSFLNKHQVKLPDQDAINIVLQGSIKIIHPKWNCQTSYFSFPPLVRNDQKKYIKSLWKHAKIVHFIGPVKPWCFECVNPYKKEYIKYKKQTPWRNESLLTLEKSKLKSFIIIFLRFCKNIIAKLVSYNYK